jgi:cyclohexanecarboxylate-CoA ligase
MTMVPARPRGRYPELADCRTATPALLAALLAEAPTRTLVIEGDRALDVRGLVAASAGVQRRLRVAGVRRGDVVTVALPNWWETIALAHAVWGMGAVLNPVTTIYRTRELTGILADARPAAVVAPTTFRGVDYQEMASAALRAAGLTVPVLAVRAGPPGGREAVGEGDTPGGRREADGEGDTPGGRREADGDVGTPAGGADAELDSDVDDVCLLLFTSGTTGPAKGVLHSHRTLLSEAASIARLFRLDGDRVFMPSPLTHITGLVYAVLMPLLMGGDAVLQESWDPTVAAALVERHGCTISIGATPFLHGLVEEYRRRGTTSSLKAFVCGGADVPPALVRTGEEVLGCVVARAYGLTEMPTVTCGALADPIEVRADTDGRVVGSSEVRLARPAPGPAGGDGAAENAAHEGDAGELEVRGPELFLGYLREDDTRAAFTADGWFRTGDLARTGAGRTVTIVGRAKDIIVRAGENLSAKEVEDLLLGHPAVAAVAVVGVPDPAVGERACAVVVPRGTPPTLADLTHYLSTFPIARQKFPEHLVTVSALPMTPSGKVQKHLLRRDAARRLERGEGESR